MSKKEFEPLKREIAEREAKARRESEDRQEKIKVLSKECKGLPNRRDFDELLDELEKLTNKYGFSLSDRLRSLHQLAELQDREIEFLTQFRRDWERIESRYPEQLQNLSDASLMLQLLLVEQAQARDSKKAWEHRRRGYKLPGGVGLIEYEFGGAGEAECQKSMLSSLLGTPLPYQPTCLDEIFRGGVGEVKTLRLIGQPPITVSTVTNMRRLEALFGMNRKRFRHLSLLSVSRGRECLYDYRAVVKIMDALLGEKATIREEGARGGSEKKRWLGNPDVRARVLRGIEDRMNSISVPQRIKSAFLKVIRSHLGDSGK
jgi:hypothetical protein